MEKYLGTIELHGEEYEVMHEIFSKYGKPSEYITFYATWKGFKNSCGSLITERDESKPIEVDVIFAINTLNGLIEEERNIPNYVLSNALRPEG